MLSMLAAVCPAENSIAASPPPSVPRLSVPMPLPSIDFPLSLPANKNNHRLSQRDKFSPIRPEPVSVFQNALLLSVVSAGEQEAAGFFGGLYSPDSVVQLKPVNPWVQAMRTFVKSEQYSDWESQKM